VTRPARGTETLLVAEDQERLRAVVARALRELGYVVLEAASPADAVRIATEHDGRIDLLLADVIMPGMRGPELARLVRDRSPNTRVLFMSGYVDDAGLGDLAGAPGVGLIAKPFTPDALAAELRALLDGTGRRG
jgi:CheY-like chemotaxis protein